MVAYLDNREQSSFGDNVLEVLQVASTLWPISFAAVAGPCLKTLALHGAEKGSSLASLEILLTSQTTVAAFKNLFMLRHIRIWTISVALLWCLSPLGGQAAVRSLHLEPNSEVSEVPALYYMGSNISDYNFFFNSTTSGIAGVFTGASAQNSLIADYRSAILASFSRPDILVSHANGSSDGFDDAIASVGGAIQAARLGQRDLWRNVRIPFLELLPGYNADDPSSWVPVSSDMVVPYASLIGIPIRGGTFNRPGNSTLTVQAHYQTLSCKPGFNGTLWVNGSSTHLVYHSEPSENGPDMVYRGPTSNAAKPNMWLDILNNSAVQEHLTDLQYPPVDYEPSSKLDLIIGGNCRLPDSTLVKTLQICEISTKYVDMEVSCNRLSAIDDLSCQAERIRHIPGFPISGSLTALSSKAIMNGLIWEMPFTTASYHMREASMVEMYINDPPLVFKRSTLGSKLIVPACFENVTLDMLNVRMATALNTAIMAMYNSTILTGGDGTSLEDRNGMWHESTATWTEFVESRYIMHKAWFSVSLASTLVLLCLSLVNVVIRCIIKAPDFLDGVAGLTRDSQYIRVPQEGSGMSGSDRLQVIKGTKVKICDVNPDANVGRIALTTNVESQNLDWSRAYR